MRLLFAAVVTTTLLLHPTDATSINSRYGAMPNLLPRSLVARQDTCTDAGSTLCNITGELSDFCCPSSTECIPLEKNTSVICCKITDTCDEIHPIECPSDPLTASKCGANCCPSGFECDSTEKKCLMKPENLPEKYKKKQQKKQDVAKNSESESENSSSSSKNTCEATLPTASCPSYPVKAILVGLFPGIVAGIALALMCGKASEVKTRRRSIKSFAAFPGSTVHLPPKNATPTITTATTSIAGFTPYQPQPQSSLYSPLSFAFRSPNLGPMVPPLRSRETALGPREPAPARPQPLQIPRPVSEATTFDFTDFRQHKRQSSDTQFSASVYTEGNVKDPTPTLTVPAPLFYRQAGGSIPRPPLEGWSRRF